MRTIINKNSIGVIVKNNSIKVLEPGRHFVFSFDEQFILHEYTSLEEQKFNITKYFNSEKLEKHIEKIDVADGCFMIRYVNNICKGIYKAGTHHFLLTDNTVKYEFFEKDQLEITTLSLDTVRTLVSMGIVTSTIIQENYKGILYVDGVQKAILKPGMYVFNSMNNDVYIRQFCFAVNTIAPQNQELLTKDKVNLRINFWANYKITNLDIILENFYSNLDEVLRNAIQMALRSCVGDKTLDEILAEKDKIGTSILNCLKANETTYGVTFIDAGIKDIILPGDIKDIMNTVLIAEKKAQANVITRREETASTRSLLNTAKLMEENAVLYRLKELEMMERIFEKVGSISVSNGNVLESLEQIMGCKKTNK